MAMIIIIHRRPYHHHSKTEDIISHMYDVATLFLETFEDKTKHYHVARL